MTREIKFRAWDKNAKTLFDWKFMQGRTTGFTFEDDNFEWMQSTGLKDKNGKDIYEGDVVRLEQWEPKLHEVLFDRGGFCFKVLGAINSNFYNDCKYLEEGEVIGNIYENPDLVN